MIRYAECGSFTRYESARIGFLSLSHFTQSYSYDKVNRLTGVTDSGGYYSRSFGYDQYGNIAVRGNSGVPYSGLTPYSGDGSNPFGAGNRLNAGGYDAAGNQTTLGSLQLGYDAENHQVLAQDGSNVAGYSYDGNGKRVLQGGLTIGTTMYVYDAFNRLAAEYFDAAAPAAPCQTCYLSTDYLGSVRLVTNETGATVGLHDYLPFGEEIPGNTAGRDGAFGGFENVQQRFTGQERDETNLDFFQARYSAATLGRFLSPDPANAGVDLLNPQSWNGYSYVVNNPLSFTDPTGLFALQDPKPAPEPDPGDFFNYCFVFSCGPRGFGFGNGSTARPAPVFLQPVKNNLRTGQDSSKSPRNGLKQKVCSAIPSGRTIGVSAGLGLFGSLGGGGELVLNYNSGQVSAFAFGGIQIGWNAGVSGSAYSGFVYGLNNSNSNYSGGFTGVNGAVGVGGFAASSNNGLSGGPSGLVPNGAVKAVGASVGAGLFGGFSGGVSATNYTNPLQLGRFSDFSPLDSILYAARQICK